LVRDRLGGRALAHEPPGQGAMRHFNSCIIWCGRPFAGAVASRGRTRATWPGCGALPPEGHP